MLSPETANILELLSVGFNLIYILLLMKEDIRCWIFGIVGSLLGIFVMINAKLYSESILYVFYALIGVYGWYVWATQGNEKDFLITRWSGKKIGVTILVGAILSYLLGYFFYKNTDANNSFLDASTTSFAFIASYLQAHKVLSNWIFWIIINGITIGLYFNRSLDFYGGVSIVFFIAAILGFIDWNKKYKNQNALT